MSGHSAVKGRSERCGDRLRSLALAVLCSIVAGSAAAEELVFLSWADYVAPEVVAEFEAETGADVRIVVFDVDEARDSTLVTQGPANYDVILVDGAALAAYRRRGWLAPLTEAEVPNLRHVEARWLDAHEAARGHAVPYFWGTTGIAYRSDEVAGPIHSWRQLLQPEESLRGRIAMIGAGRDLLLPALKLLGESVNFADPAVLRPAEELLQAQKPFVKTYVYVSVTEESALVTGEVWLALMYSGGAQMLAALDPAIAYAVPDEGTNLWVDYLAVSALSPRRALAARFVDFLNRPDVARRNALWLRYATPNAAAAKLLPESFLKDPVIYPPQAVMDRSEIDRPLSPRVRKAVNSTLNRLLH